MEDVPVVHAFIHPVKLIIIIIIIIIVCTYYPSGVNGHWAPA
jgi:uncharacterized membrane protein